MEHCCFVSKSLKEIINTRLDLNKYRPNYYAVLIISHFTLCCSYICWLSMYLFVLNTKQLKSGKKLLKYKVKRQNWPCISLAFRDNTNIPALSFLLLPTCPPCMYLLADFFFLFLDNDHDLTAGTCVEHFDVKYLWMP